MRPDRIGRAHGTSPPGSRPRMGYQVTDVQKALKGADYPASSEQLADLASSNGADDDLVQAIRGMGGDTYDGPNAVMQAMKGDLGG